MNAVAAETVSVRAGAKPLIEDVSFSVGRGEWVSILGPNGAGKTTVLRALAGLVRCSGRVALAGKQTASLSPRAIARLVSLVPQRPVIPAEMTVAEYVLLGRTPHVGTLAQESAEDWGVAGAALARLDLEPFAHRLLGSLSGESSSGRSSPARSLRRRRSSSSTSRRPRSTSGTSRRFSTWSRSFGGRAV